LYPWDWIATWLWWKGSGSGWKFVPDTLVKTGNAAGRNGKIVRQVCIIHDIKLFEELLYKLRRMTDCNLDLKGNVGQEGYLYGSCTSHASAYAM
jgi:hypothetical protein